MIAAADIALPKRRVDRLDKLCFFLAIFVVLVLLITITRASSVIPLRTLSFLLWFFNSNHSLVKHTKRSLEIAMFSFGLQKDRTLIFFHSLGSLGWLWTQRNMWYDLQSIKTWPNSDQKKETSFLSFRSISEFASVFERMVLYLSIVQLAQSTLDQDVSRDEMDFPKEK